MTADDDSKSNLVMKSVAISRLYVRYVQQLLPSEAGNLVYMMELLYNNYYYIIYILKA